MGSNPASQQILHTAQSKKKPPLYKGRDQSRAQIFSILLYWKLDGDLMLGWDYLYEYERVHDTDNLLRLQKTNNLLNLKPVIHPLGFSLCNVFVPKTTESGLHCASVVFKYWHSIAVMLILYNIHTRNSFKTI